MLLIVIRVQQLEGHVLQPFLIGNAVKVHPLAVVIAVATGGFLAGIPGALFAVPRRGDVQRDDRLHRPRRLAHQPASERLRRRPPHERALAP